MLKQDPLVLLGIVALGILVQQLENNLVVPRVMGQAVNLHPVAVIFALLAFGQLFGFAGVLFALPASAVLLVALRHLRKAYNESALYR